MITESVMRKFIQKVQEETFDGLRSKIAQNQLYGTPITFDIRKPSNERITMHHTPTYENPAIATLTAGAAKEYLEKLGYTVVKTEPAKWPFHMTVEDLVSQKLIWIDKYGTRYSIRDMTLDYVANVLTYLQSNAFRKPHQFTIDEVERTPLYDILEDRLYDPCRYPDEQKYDRPKNGPATYHDEAYHRDNPTPRES